MIIKKSIVALMVACSFTLSAGVALGKNLLLDKFRSGDMEYTIKVKMGGKKSGMQFIVKEKDTLRNRSNKYCQHMRTNTIQELDRLMNCLADFIQDSHTLDNIEKTIKGELRN